MKKKLVGVLLTAAMAVSALAGCGSKEAAAPAESKAAEEKTETVQEASRKKLRLRRGRSPDCMVLDPNLMYMR